MQPNQLSHTGSTTITTLQPMHVLITSYGLLHQEIELLSSIRDCEKNDPAIYLEAPQESSINGTSLKKKKALSSPSIEKNRPSTRLFVKMLSPNLALSVTKNVFSSSLK